MISRAAQRWSVSAALLAAQLYAESNFNPFARSRVGALGIAQFMPGTAAGLGLDNPFDAERAIDAQAHLMRDLLRRFGSVPLALAAYHAGPNPVAGCGCVPPFPETRAYVGKDPRPPQRRRGAGHPGSRGRTDRAACPMRRARPSRPKPDDPPADAVRVIRRRRCGNSQ
jgi:soluble lytic murein transglycosylase-like protein